MNVQRLTATITAALALSTSACAGNRALHAGGASSASRYVTVLVANQNYSPMAVYAIVKDVPIRLGTATGNATTRFIAHPGLFATGWLRIVASQPSGRDVADSGPVEVHPGQSVTFTIEQNAAVSLALAR